MTKTIRLKKGLDIRIKGKAEKQWLPEVAVSEVGICPDDFIGLVPKPLVKEGEKVKAGSPLFYHKDFPQIVIASPVSGILKEIKRGAKRKIEAFVIESDDILTYDDTFVKESFESYTSAQWKEFFLKSGLWAYIRQRPFNIVADPNALPQAIFISSFDTAPLAPDLEFILSEDQRYLQIAIDTLKKLVDVPVYVGLKEGMPSVFENINNIEIFYFSGPHPAGNVGVQIHHIRPINKGEVVWVIRPEDLVVIGKYVVEKRYDVRRTIIMAGSQLKQRGYVKTIQGAKLSQIIDKSLLEPTESRFISGNVLTGSNVGYDGYLGFYDRMISVIPEGKYYEFIGWAMPGFKKYSVSRTFFSWLMPKKEYVLDTNYHGGERAFVMTGQYEKVVPMDILPQQLVKAAIIKDIDLMEKLGIYEVVEEDLALCEFVCTSKIEVQKIIREALDYIRSEMS